MSQPTHASLATFRIDLTREAEQRPVLEGVIVPGVISASGVVAGTWTLDRSSGESLVLITYLSLEAAEAMVENIRGNAENQAASGLELVSVRILEVAASG